jgi:HK97 family phage prohead protease
MNEVYAYKLLDCEVKDVDRKARIVKGYFSAFNIKDSDGDVIRPGAFAKSIQENGPKSGRPRIKHLLNHNTWAPLGKIQDLKEDNYGLLYESKIGTHSDGENFLKMIDSGLITEHSIGYRIMKWERSQDDDDRTMYLNELKLWEGSSLTAWGANEFTPLVAAKGQTVDELERKMKLMEKFCETSDATDDLIELMTLYMKQLHQHILDLKTTTEPARTTQPGNRANEAAVKAINDLHALFV